MRLYFLFRNGDICGNWGQPTCVTKKGVPMVNQEEEEKYYI